MQELDHNVDVDDKLSYVYDAITLTRHKLEGQVPLIGFAGGPVKYTYIVLYLPHLPYTEIHIALFCSGH